MRVLLVTWTDQLLEKLSILSPELEYCAIVVDEVEPAKKLLEQANFPKDLVYPLYDLKECVRDFYYDYVLCVENQWWESDLFNQVKNYNVTENKLLAINILGYESFFIERLLRYFKTHAAEFEIFATGMSYAANGLDITKFKRKLFNFGRFSQDLYYDFQTAKFAISCGGGGKQFSLCVDLSGTILFSLRFLQSK